jgi:UDP-N-acetylmuramoyl-tripeptide--D-alanyl-D-alanine ligase
MSLQQVAAAIGASMRPQDGAVRVRRVTTDSRDVQPGDMFFAIVGERFDGHRFVEEAVSKGAVACVTSRDHQVPRESRPAEAPRSVGNRTSAPRLVVPDTIEALGRLAAFYRREVMPISTQVIAVTGSNGKTTTKCMIDHVLGAAMPGRSSPRSFNNHVGLPLTILSTDADDRYLVVEIGTNAPGEVASLAAITSPDVAVITSIGEAHCEGLGDVAAIAAEKASLLDHLRPHGLVLVNVDRPEIRPHLDRPSHARLMTFGFDRHAGLRVSSANGTLEGSSFKLDSRFHVELRMPGMHHATNAAAVFGVARWFGLEPADIIAGLRSFTAPAGRTTLMNIGGVKLIDDTYNANPASMAAAIETLSGGASGRRVMVMGDMLELGADTAPLHRRVVGLAFDAGIEILVAVGPAMIDAVRVLAGEAGPTQLVMCANAEAASDILVSLLSEGDACWVKGSRLMQLDRVVSYVKAHWGVRAAVA